MLYLTDDKVRPGNGIGLMLGILVAEQVFKECGCDLGIYSLNDRNHGSTSLHFSDNAVDFRTKDLASGINRNVMAAQIKKRLNKHYDVIYENGSDGEHIHMEFQPRGNR